VLILTSSFFSVCYELTFTPNDEIEFDQLLSVFKLLYW
jgi:hypothetical protein